MTGNAFSLAAAPLLPWYAIAALGVAALLILAFGVLRGARGVLWRVIAVAILLAALVNPSVVEEKRDPQRDTAIIIVDESPSQRIGNRQRATDEAQAALSDRLAYERNLDVRVVRAGKPQPGAGDDGTRLFTALTRAMSDVPRQRLAPGPRQRNLPYRRSRLAVLELERAGRQLEHGAAERNRAGRDDQEIAPVAMQRGQVSAQRRKPRFAQPTGTPINKQGRPDLHDNPAEVGKRRNVHDRIQDFKAAAFQSGGAREADARYSSASCSNCALFSRQ